MGVLVHVVPSVNVEVLLACSAFDFVPIAQGNSTRCGIVDGMLEQDAVHSNRLVAPPGDELDGPSSEALPAGIGKDPVGDFGVAPREVDVQCDATEHQVVVRVHHCPVDAFLA